MSNDTDHLALRLSPEDHNALSHTCGRLDEHLRLIEKQLGVHIAGRGFEFTVSGTPAAAKAARDLLSDIYSDCLNGDNPGAMDVQVRAQQAASTTPAAVAPMTLITTQRGTIKPRGRNQTAYVKAIRANDINFGVGPAGTGKTWLAVACAVEALLQDRVQRIMLVRPAVEAGEKLGFLPGDLAQKIDPYLRPLYDALYEMLGSETVNKLIERNIIEIAPLAFMRGRSLNDSFIILDESQNTTREQMKMFLTRIGFGSTAVITGDATQIDLPKGTHSGLLHALKVLDGVEGISCNWFSSSDVVRHPLVQKIVDAYDQHSTDTATLDSKNP